MSDECKRLFSSAKLTIVNCHSRLKVDIIEVNIFEPSMEGLSWKIIVIVMIVRMMIMRLITNNMLPQTGRSASCGLRINWHGGLYANYSVSLGG